MIRFFNLLSVSCLILFAHFSALAQQHPSAALQISSTTRGFLPPRMSKVERDAITSPAQGLIVFCTDCQPDGALYLYTGANQWTNLAQTSAPSQIADTDGNTGLQTEKTANDNTLRFQTDGVEHLTLDSNGRLHLRGAFRDSRGTAGTLGQVLATTTNGTQWIDAPAPKRLSDRNGSLGTKGQVLTVNQNNELQWSFPPTPHRIADSDGNTQVQTQKTAGENILRFDTSGQERMTLDASGRLHLRAAFRDAGDHPGTAGQLLSSTSTATRWIDTPSATAITDANGDTGNPGEILLIDTNGNLQWQYPDKIPDSNDKTGSAGQILTINQNGQLVWTNNNDLKDDNGDSGMAGEILYINPDGKTEWVPLNQIRDANRMLGETGQVLSIDQNGNLVWTDRNQITDSTGSTGSSGQVLTINQNGTHEWAPLPIPHRIADSDGNTQIQVEKTNDDDRIHFDTNGSERMRITAAGNLGIGHTDPDDRLDLVGSLHLSGALKDSGGSTGTAGQVLASTGNATQWINSTSDVLTDNDNNTRVRIEKSNEKKIRFDTGGTERVIIDQNGNVGIGTSTPQTSAILELSSTTKGFLPPRMNAAQRDALTPKAVGTTIYNTENKQLEIWNGHVWDCSNRNKCVVHSLDLNNDGDFDDPGEYNLRRYETIVSPATGKRWLDRNIGATRVATGVNDVAVIGDNKGLGFYYSFEDAKKACPSGYHLPTNSEWCAETRSFHQTAGCRDELTNPNGISNAQTAFDRLKLIRTGWNATDGTASVADNGVFADHGHYWSVSGAYLFFSDSYAYLQTVSGTGGSPVRCIQD